MLAQNWPGQQLSAMFVCVCSNHYTNTHPHTPVFLSLFPDLSLPRSGTLVELLLVGVVLERFFFWCCEMRGLARRHADCHADCHAGF